MTSARRLGSPARPGLARWGARYLRIFSFAVALVCLALPAAAQQQKQRLRVDDYVIDAQLFPATHQIAARARGNGTALDAVNPPVLKLHSALHPTKVEDAAGKTIPPERVTQDSTIRLSLPTALTKGTSTTFTFEYEGALQSGDDSPVPGLKLAYVSDDTSYLMYAGRWFPTLGYGTNRFTATFNIT